MDIHKLLQQDIQSKINKKKLYGSDCNILSQQIYDETQRQLSSSTLKRFFGFIKSKYKPSKYTLDTLAVYVGFNDWNEYVNCYEDTEHKDSSVDSWNLLKKRMELVTAHSIESLKQKTNYSKHNFIFRDFVKERFNKLEQTNKSATIFVAPDGYGKSTLMLQLVEKYFLEDGAPLKEDIVCLIDGKIFFNLYAKKYINIEVLNQLIDFKIHSSLNLFFQKNPEQRKGRIWLFIDNVDEVFFDKDRYHQLIENIVRILMVNDGSWFKVILSCRPENLEIFTYSIKKNPLLKSYWYDVEFFKDKYIDAINIPLYSIPEIKAIIKLQNAEKEYTEILRNSEDVLDIIARPYSLSLFLAEYKENRKISEVILLNRFIKSKILSPPFLEEKLQLVNQYAILCNRGKETTSVEKDKLLSGSNLLLAYQQLVSDGIIYEYIIPEGTIDFTVFINFNQEVVFNYLVLRLWSKDKPYSAKLFFEIMEFYNNNNYMQCNILKLFIKKFLHNNELVLIKEIHDTFRKMLLPAETYSNIPDCMNAITAAIKDVLEDNKDLQNLFDF